MRRILSLLLILIVSVSLIACNDTNTNNKGRDDIYEAISLDVGSNPSLLEITEDFKLINSVLSLYVVTWESNSEAITVNNNIAIVTQYDKDSNVSLVASVLFQGEDITKEFELIVLADGLEPVDPIEPEEPVVITKEALLDEITIDLGANNSNLEITNNFSLTDLAFNEYSITWISSNNDVISISDNKIARVTRASSDLDITLTASTTLEGEAISKTFSFKVLAKEANNTSETFFQDFGLLIQTRNDSYDEPQSQYISEYDISLNNVSYDIINYRTDAGLNSQSKKVITLGGFGNEESEAGRGFIRANDLTGGLDSFEFFARLPFSPESTYPQVNGKDTYTNSTITFSVYKDNLLEFQTDLKFASNKEADKGKLFTIDNIGVTGEYTYVIEINSGMRLSLTNFEWKTLPSTDKEHTLIQHIDFYRLEMLEFMEGEIMLNDHNYLVGGFRSNYTDIHPSKELPFIVAENEKDIVRLKEGFIQNIEHFEEVSKVSFMARNFGDYAYPHNSKIAVSYQVLGTNEWILVKDDFDLSIDFKTFEVEINQANVLIKIESMRVLDAEVTGTVNLDNVRYYK